MKIGEFGPIPAKTPGFQPPGGLRVVQCVRELLLGGGNHPGRTPRPGLHRTWARPHGTSRAPPLSGAVRTMAGSGRLRPPLGHPLWLPLPGAWYSAPSTWPATWSSRSHARKAVQGGVLFATASSPEAPLGPHSRGGAAERAARPAGWGNALGESVAGYSGRPRICAGQSLFVTRGGT